MRDENRSRLKSTRDQYGVAFHEAGHVVVATALGLAIGYVELAIDGDDAKGAAEIEDNSKLSLVDQLAVCAAGPEAQRLFAAPTHSGAGWADYGMMIKLVEGLTDEHSRNMRYAGYQRAHDLLVQHADKVERLAKHLLTKKHLMRGELHNVLGTDQRHRGRI
ncbi:MULTISPECIES: hypothetical protein [unclassified Bradyrhizobium]|uniref:hypothetical protein n=1 Tax=unclassified Bradyrhizobium TaxID=2631580 RepID=UPI002915E102|nr:MULTISPECIES: hypothetical protein [unclassified Bradyrhizobium]